MSLPYPSMVFVPLDILTAEEMNQIVGNIESLAAGTGLADGAITSDKIDSTTLNAYKPGDVVDMDQTRMLGLCLTRSNANQIEVYFQFNKSLALVNGATIVGPSTAAGGAGYVLSANNPTPVVARPTGGQTVTGYKHPQGLFCVFESDRSLPTYAQGLCTLVEGTITFN